MQLYRLVFTLALGLLALPFGAPAQPSVVATKDLPKSSTKDSPSSKARPIPFRGKLTSVDKIGQTITVGARIFKITPETKLYRGPSKLPAYLSDAVLNEQITGSYVKKEDGALVAYSVYFASRAPSKEAEEKKADQKKGKTTNNVSSRLVP